MLFIQIAAPFVAATIALTGVWWTVHQKDLSERRAEWWRRATWALEKATQEREDESQVGWLLLGALLGSGLETRTENAVIEVLATLNADVDTGDDLEGSGDEESDG